jgi:hypothetical protein
MIFVGNERHALEGMTTIEVFIVDGFILTAQDTITGDWWAAEIRVKSARRSRHS